MRVMRDYQVKAIDAIRGEFGRGVQSTLCVLPTGTGKTVIFAKLSQDWDSGRVLVLAHRIELLDQAADKLATEIGYRPPVEQGQRRYDYDGGFIEPDAIVI